MPDLLSPVSIGSVKLRNRIIMPSMVTNFAGVNGEVTEKLICYHRARAAGGVGLNILEATCVEDSGRSYFPGVSIASDYYIKGLRKLTDAIHQAGGKAAVQLNHAGRLSKPDASHMPVPLVSLVPPYTAYNNSVVLDAEDISHLVSSFIDAAVRAKKAGFDIIEVHGAHGYLIAQFMSPLFNRRTDCYGGSYENRMRFPVEIIQGIREKLGKDFPLFFRCSSEEFLPGGIDLDLTCRIACTVAEAGIDLIHVSAGLGETNEFTGPPPYLPCGWNAGSAARIRSSLRSKGLNASVAVAGRIIDRETAQSVLDGEKADMVVMGRALIADPDLPNKLTQGRDADIIPCIGCNEGCNGRLGERKPIECAVNPCTGREGIASLKKTDAPKKILVVGAGPAGMEAALTLSRRGHSVCLYEKSEFSGGLVRTAALPPHKEILNRLVSYYEKALHDAGVQMFFGHALTADEIAAMERDFVIVATGSRAILPKFAAGLPVLTAEDVLNGVQTGKDVLIVGGGMVGCETAEFLARQDKNISILELRSELAPDMHARARKFLLKELAAHGVKKYLETELLSMEQLSDAEERSGSRIKVQARSRYGREYALPAYDSVVMAVGYRSENTLCGELEARKIPFVPLGDCVRPGKIMSAIHDAHQTACRMEYLMKELSA